MSFRAIFTLCFRFTRLAKATGSMEEPPRRPADRTSKQTGKEGSDWRLMETPAPAHRVEFSLILEATVFRTERTEGFNDSAKASELSQFPNVCL